MPPLSEPVESLDCEAPDFGRHETHFDLGQDQKVLDRRGCVPHLNPQDPRDRDDRLPHGERRREPERVVLRAGQKLAGIRLIGQHRRQGGSVNEHQDLS